MEASEEVARPVEQVVQVVLEVLLLKILGGMESMLSPGIAIIALERARDAL